MFPYFFHSLHLNFLLEIYLLLNKTCKFALYTTTTTQNEESNPMRFYIIALNYFYNFFARKK